MIDTARKIDFITDYLISYESKVKLLNTLGLFDNAKHFELLALNLAEILFNKIFTNCNDERFNYPYVDLLSEDKKTYIQVSTTSDLKVKIDKTIKKINDNALDKNIEELFFIFLDNSDLKELENIQETNYFVKKNVINIQTIIKQAQSNHEICEKIYSLLTKVFIAFEDNLNKYRKALDSSSYDVVQLNSTIGGSYSIDRISQINEVQKLDAQNTIISGNAGIGKSVLCKLLLSGKKVLYARAEKIVAAQSIDDIWQFDLENILEYLGKLELYVFIDSLESIADNTQKNNNLPYLLEILKAHQNVKILMTCRSADLSAFSQIIQKYNVCNYELCPISDEEKEQIGKLFPTIQPLINNRVYSDLLSNPWYINMIVLYIRSLNGINDENDLRDKIWTDFICRKCDTCTATERRNTLSDIILKRSNEASLYVPKDEYNIAAVDSLISDDILIVNPSDKNYIRTKYDIFEDIYFERDIDKKYKQSKGDFNKFFSDVESLGNCVFRRYQIWISNKLFVKYDRERFIKDIVFSSAVPQKWKEQTIIGIIKSIHSKAFLKEYSDLLCQNDFCILKEFIRLTNLYCFELDFKNQERLSLLPIGCVRDALINFVFENKVYLNAALQYDIEKMIYDWSNSRTLYNTPKDCFNNVSAILKYYIDNKLENKDHFYTKRGSIIRDLDILYKISKYSGNIIIGYWNVWKNWLISENQDERYIASELISDALKYTHVALSMFLPDELCSLATYYWRVNYLHPSKKRNRFDDRGNGNYHIWGVNGHLENNRYDTHEKVFLFRSFYYNLLRFNFEIALKFIVNFLNDSINYCKLESPEQLDAYTLIVDGQDRDYFGNEDLWLAFRGEGNCPELIKDLLLCFEYHIIDAIETANDESLNKSPNAIKCYIYNKSNNIALFPIIASIAMKNPNIPKDFAIDLATNIDLVMFDLRRYACDVRGFSANFIGVFTDWEKEILHKHHFQEFRKNTLQKYVLDLSLIEEYKNKVYSLIDALYSKVPNDKEHDVEYLNILKMDFRKAEISPIDDNIIAVAPKIDGAAAEVSKQNEEYMAPAYACLNEVSTILNNMKDGIVPMEDIVSAINKCIFLKEKLYLIPNLNKALDLLIQYALNSDELNLMTREVYIDLMLSKYQELIQTNQIAVPGFDALFSKVRIFGDKSYYILFAQLEKDLPTEYKNKIKKAIIKIVLNGYHSGGLLDTLNVYLQKNTLLKNEMLYYMIWLFEKETNEWKRYITKKRTIESYFFDLDNAIDECLKISPKKDKFELDNKFTNLVYAFAVLNLQLGIKEYGDIYERLFDYYINNIENIESEYRGMSYDQEYALREALQFNLINDEDSAIKVVELLFDNKYISKIPYKMEEFYIETIGSLVPIYFDAYNDSSKRNYICKILDKIKEKVRKVEVSKKNLSNCLTFTRPKYYGSWENYQTSYSLTDKKYISTCIKEFGIYNPAQVFENIYVLHSNELLPEILIGMVGVIDHISAEELNKSKDYLISIMSQAFCNHFEKIKDSKDLSIAFEKVLLKMIAFSIPEAALILDEFRIH